MPVLAFPSTTVRFHAWAVDSSGSPVSSADIRLYVHNYTAGSWWNGTTWQLSRTYVSMIEDSNVSGYYFKDVLMPSTANVGLNLFADPVTGTIANGPWDEEVWIEENDESTASVLEELFRGNFIRLEGFLKRIEQLTNQIFNIVRR